MTHGPPIKPHQRVCICPSWWDSVDYSHTAECSAKHAADFRALVAKTREDFKKEAG